MVMYIITSKLNSTFGTIGKATGIKMTAKAASKNSSSRFSMKNFKICTCGDTVKRLRNLEYFLLLTRFLHISLNEKLLLLTFSSHFFHLVPCIWKF